MVYAIQYNEECTLVRLIAQIHDPTQDRQHFRTVYFQQSQKCNFSHPTSHDDREDPHIFKIANDLLKKDW